MVFSSDPDRKAASQTIRFNQSFLALREPLSTKLRALMYEAASMPCIAALVIACMKVLLAKALPDHQLQGHRRNSATGSALNLQAAWHHS